MEGRLEEELAGKELSAEICEKKEIKEFDPFFFKKIEKLGEGAFGSVEKCVDIRDRTIVAVKKIKIKGVKDKIGNISSFLVEGEILKRILQRSHPHLAKYLGGFYVKDNAGVVESLVLVTEAGDFSLKQLIKCRLDSKNGNAAAYTPDEVFQLLEQLLPAYQALREMNIYHSDTKPENIVFSRERKGFIIIDFGVANVISEKVTNEGINLSSYIRGGTEGYNSPEKQFYFDKKGVIPDDLDKFNPFACDMWSLGAVIEKMSLPINDKLPGATLLKEIISKLKEKDWRGRYCVEDLISAISKYKPQSLDFNDTELRNIDSLEDERRKNYSEMFELFDEAFMPHEQLKMALKERASLEEKHGKINNLNSSHFEGNTRHLGKIPTCILLIGVVFLLSKNINSKPMPTPDSLTITTRFCISKTCLIGKKPGLEVPSMKKSQI